MKTIYLNHAGTSWPIPLPVQQAVHVALESYPADWNEDFRRHHQAICDFFHISDCDQLLLTPGCTSALAVGIEDQPWKAGDRALTSCFEHHALRRPLEKLSQYGIKLDTIPASDEELVDLTLLEQQLSRGDVRLVAMTAACNVTGELLPLDEVLDLCRSYKVTTLIDAAQIVGWWDLDIPAMGADFVAFGAHKGMQAPWGIGGLYLAPNVQMECLSATCDLAQRESISVPSYCDVGSVDRIALSGWAAAANWLKHPSQINRLATARGHSEALRNTLANVQGIELIGTSNWERRLPVVAFRVGNNSSTEVSRKLAERGVIAGSGFQCAPLAHQTLGTEATGLVRLSAGPTTTAKEVEAASEILVEVLSKMSA